jgi:hypothetical protein
MRFLVKLMMGLLALFSAFAVATSANAGGDHNPVSTPTQLPPTVTMNLSGSKVKVAAADVASGKVTILSDMMLKAGVNVHSSKCFWTKPGQVWYNGGYGVNGAGFQKETVPGKLCPSSKSHTHWVKVAGGHTGRRCFNEAKLGHSPGPVIKGPVIWVHSLAKVRVHIHAVVKAVAVGYVNVNGAAQECGRAEARASSSVWVRLKSFLRIKNAKNTAVKLYGRVYAKASARASAQVECGSVNVTVQTSPSPLPQPSPSPTPSPTPKPPAPKPTPTPSPTPKPTPTPSPSPTPSPTPKPSPTPTPTPPPVQHSCNLTVGNASKDDPYTAAASVTTDSAATVVINWGDGQVTGPGWHTYPTPPESSNAGDGVTYTVSASASFGDHTSVNCSGTTNFFVPAPPPNGNTDPPPLPPGMAAARL